MYTDIGDIVTIYIDLILFLNFCIDFILLSIVNIVLKRYKSLTRIIIGAFIGSLSVILLFFNMTSFELFIYKIILGILMVLITYGYKNIKYTIKNFLYLYMVSIILGGFMYYLNVTFSYKREGIIFIFKGLSINAVIIFVISPIILYLYLKQMREQKNNYNNYHKVEIYIKDKVINCIGFIDTGNKLVDPYMNRPIILIPKDKIDIVEEKILVPYITIDNTSMLECINVDNVVIDNKEYKSKLLVGLIDKKINIDGVDCILNYKLMEDI